VEAKHESGMIRHVATADVQSMLQLTVTRYDNFVTQPRYVLCGRGGTPTCVVVGIAGLHVLTSELHAFLLAWVAERRDADSDLNANCTEG
jgi:hypothetical protein